MPFKESFPMTQDWNDKRYRASYAKFGLLGHNGQDFGTPAGTPILAPHPGKVIEAALDTAGYGWYVKIENDKEGSTLAHFKDSPKVKVGDSVTLGQCVGLSGNTGNSTGPHLHWGYYRFPRNREDGFNGYLNQTHWMNIDDQNHLDELIDANAQISKLNASYKLLEEKYVKDGQSATEAIKNLQRTTSEQSALVVSMNETIQQSAKENKSLLEACRASELKYLDVTTKKDKEISLLQQNQDRERIRAEKAEKTTQKLQEKLSQNLIGYSKWERLFSLFKK